MSTSSEAILSTSTIAWIVSGSTICWSVLYFMLHKGKWGQQTPEFYCRVVTVIHAIVAVILSAVCFWLGPNPYISPGEPNTVLSDITLSVSLGYFFYDLVWCLYHQTETAIMIIHHICSIISIGIVLVERTSGPEAVQGIFSMELTNPLLQLRWFLRTAGFNKTLVHTAVELLFVALFLFMRLVIGTWLTYTCWVSGKVKTIVKLCTLFLHLVSLAFIGYIFQFIQKKYTNKKHKASD